MILKRGLERAARAVVESLRKSATPVTGREQVAEVASISAGNSEIGELIGEVMDRVGRDGLVTVEEGSGFGFSVEYVEGMEFDQGPPFAVLRHRFPPNGCGNRRPVYPDYRSES